MADSTTDSATLITGLGTSSPERITRTRTIDELVEEAGALRTEVRLLADDVEDADRRTREAHQQVVNRQLEARARRAAKQGMSALLSALADRGLAWRDIAALAGVTVPAVRRWRQGDPSTGDHLLAVARIVALVDTLEQDHLVANVASWMEMPLADEAPLTAIDLAVAGRLSDVLDVAGDHATGEAVLERWLPGWREKYRSGYEVFEAADGELGTRPVSQGGS